MSTPPVAPFILGYYGRYGRKPLYAHGREHIAALDILGIGNIGDDRASVTRIGAAWQKDSGNMMLAV